MEDFEHAKAEKFVTDWFKKKPNTKINKSILGDSIILKIPNKSYAEIYILTRFAGENIWPKSEIDCWNTFWVCAGLPALKTKYWEDDDADDDFEEETGLARLVAVPSKKLLIATAKKHNLFALYNQDSEDLGETEGKSRDMYTLNLAVAHPVKAEDLQRLYNGVHEFVDNYANVRKVALKQKSVLSTELDKVVDNILAPRND